MRFVWLGGFLLAACGLAAGSFLAVDQYFAWKREQRVSSDPAIIICETITKARLKAPSSYKRVEAKIHGDTVQISYDAVNSYNAPLRGHHICQYEINDDGHVVFARSGDAVEATRGMEALTAEIKKAGDDGSFRTKQRDFERLYNERMMETVDVMKFLVLDHETAERTGLQPVPPNQTLVRPKPSELQGDRS